MSNYGGGGSSGGGGGESRVRALYGTWINEALQRNDPNELQEVVKRARDIHFYPMYGVAIDKAIERGASTEELQELLERAEATLNSDLQGAIERLRKHLGT